MMTSLKFPSQTADEAIMIGKITLLTLVAVASSFGQSSQQEQTHARRLWISSVVAIAGASAFDAGTSWGKMEGNGFLASSNGTFGMKGVSIKAAIAAAVLIPQVVVGRHHPQLWRRFTVGNFAEAGMYGAIGAHNTTIH